MERISSHRLVVDSFLMSANHARMVIIVRLLTRCLNELVVEFVRKYGIWQLSKECFQQTSDTIHVVTKVFRIAKVNARWVCVDASAMYQ
jgi:hypothetical protein